MLIRTLAPAALLAAAVVALTALAHDSVPTKPATPAAAAAPAATPPAAPTEKGATLARGEKLKGLPGVKLAELVAAPEKYQDKSVRVEGTVRRACSKMGCWMELAESAAPAAAGIRVLMKDHGFFVPTDSAGSKATVEGKVSVETLSDEDAKHFESEGGTVLKGKDGKPREVQVTAVGVEMVRS